MVSARSWEAARAAAGTSLVACQAVGQSRDSHHPKVADPAPASISAKTASWSGAAGRLFGFTPADRHLLDRLRSLNRGDDGVAVEVLGDLAARLDGSARIRFSYCWLPSDATLPATRQRSA